MASNSGLRLAFAFIPVAALAACHMTGPVQTDYIAANQPSRVWVTETDDSTSVVEGPRILGDTLAGFVRGEYREIPMSNVKQVVARQPARKRTILSLTAGALAGAGILYLITGSGRGASDIPEDDEAPPN